VPFGQSQGYLVAGLGDDTLKGGTGNAHAPGRLNLAQALQVGQAQGFQLLMKERDAV
jgi:hypothetical protein